ncbi:hypothetical protein H6F43_01110 [Leptolyngbya sp. FACHB-36]|uniref:hypothetical protein n=1 Tax=Leptolyngbya sp. FACHB-36 TaxID=2692808 RepID=UPI0016816286|nr:hypothetical protein [Leptolyngbya sp. FACHB-36]MBD2018782.1 hypothetical protein [Leptolyngbya sp. FACHB-36]
MDDLVFPRRCECGCSIPLSTLQVELHCLVLRHTLPEVLDRLTDMVEQQSRLDGDLASRQAWDQVALHLERSVKAALAVTSLKSAAGGALWR